MTDRELLELAAKAAGIEYEPVGCFLDWNPLTNDGDALRLAVKLFFEIEIGLGCVAIRHLSGIKILEPINNNPCSATRRAIVRAAAEIWKEMK